MIPILPSSCTVYTVHTRLAESLSTHIPLLVESYILAAADMFGHSGACMIDVFLAVKHLALTPTPTVRHYGGTFVGTVYGAASWAVAWVMVPEFLHSLRSTYRCWQPARRAANAARGWSPAIILRIVTELKNAYPACLAPGIAPCQ